MTTIEQIIEQHRECTVERCVVLRGGIGWAASYYVPCPVKPLAEALEAARLSVAALFMASGEFQGTLNGAVKLSADRIAFLLKRAEEAEEDLAEVSQRVSEFEEDHAEQYNEWRQVAVQLAEREERIKALEAGVNAFINHYRTGDGCSNCGGLPHSAGCFVGRFEALR